MMLHCRVAGHCRGPTLQGNAVYPFTKPQHISTSELIRSEILNWKLNASDMDYVTSTSQNFLESPDIRQVTGVVQW